jgi:uncharacterized protein (DUF952 family)
LRTTQNDAGVFPGIFTKIGDKFASGSNGSIHRMTLIYKICPHALWQEAEHDGVFRGAPVDRADGYIHFSTAAQARETAARHFAGQSDLVLVAVETEPLGPALKWEPSRGGALFPHLYAELSLRHVRSVAPLPLGADGVHQFPRLGPGSGSHAEDRGAGRDDSGDAPSVKS